MTTEKKLDPVIMTQFTGSESLYCYALTGALVVITEEADAVRKEGWRRKGVRFFENTRSQLRDQLKMILRAERRLRSAIYRSNAVKQRIDHRG